MSPTSPDNITDAEASALIKQKFEQQVWRVDAESAIAELNELQSPKAVDADAAVGSDDVNTYFEKRGRAFDNTDARRYYASIWDHLTYDERRDLDLLPFRYELFEDLSPGHASIDIKWLIDNRDAIAKLFAAALKKELEV